MRFTSIEGTNNAPAVQSVHKSIWTSPGQSLRQVLFSANLSSGTPHYFNQHLETMATMEDTKRDYSAPLHEDINQPNEPHQEPLMKELTQLPDIYSSTVEVMTPHATRESLEVDNDIYMDISSLSEGQLGDSGDLAAAHVDNLEHPPTPPGSESPPSNAAERKFSFSSSNLGDDETIILKKKPRGGTKKGRGYGGVRKKHTKKKQVRFRDPIFEIRLIDCKAPVALDLDTTSTPIIIVPAKHGTRTSALKKDENPVSQIQVQPVRGINWTGFGKNHLPKHYPSIPKREALLKAEEDKLDKALNKAYVFLPFLL
jgi:hypothetical protein